MSKLDDAIQLFFKSQAFAVIGASNDRTKYGNKVLRVYMQRNKKVYPVNPHEKKIEGLDCYSEINELPNDVKSISIITPPHITEKIVSQSYDHGITNIWMQPGAESQAAISFCEKHNLNVIAGGPCILVHLGFHEK